MGCSHKSTVTTVTAGLAREVCEICGRVSVRYVDRAVRLRPPDADARVDLTERTFEAEIVFAEGSQHRRCMHCAQLAVFMIPEGIACDEHAWQAAARLDWEATDPWVPIRIDRSNAPPR